MPNEIEQPVTGSEVTPQTATVETPNPEPANGTTPEAPNQDETPEQLRARLASAEKRISELNKENESKRKKAEEAEKNALAEQGKFKELYESEVARREAAESTATKLAHERLVDRIAAEHKLPDELRDRLRGDTEDELREDAKQLAKFAQPARPQAPDLDAERRGGSSAIVSDDEMAEVARMMGMKVPAQK